MQAPFYDFGRADFGRVDIERADFERADFGRADFGGADFYKRLKYAWRYGIILQERCAERRP